ncbi:MAG: hypothetical protein F6K42_34885 [Leptolyngbya sp. SIO1D8]|nr:hypothetical protein [Leptolyngbya sp. SIO1D8]
MLQGTPAKGQLISPKLISPKLISPKRLQLWDLPKPSTETPYRELPRSKEQGRTTCKSGGYSYHNEALK